MSEWKQREISRLADGIYKPLPNQLCLVLDFPADHFIHLSVTGDEADFIAYTPSDAYGKADRQVRLKFGRYLKKTFPSMSDAFVQAHVTTFKSALAVAAEPLPPALHFATDRDTLNCIFETQMYACGSSCSSCMWNKFDDWDVRPYHVYADSPDVAVAYVLAHDDRIVSRSVVSTKDKTWVRLYSVAGGDNDSACGTLRGLLDAAGYQKGELWGNRLTKLPERRGHGEVLPYIDNGGQQVSESHDGKYWEVVEEDGEWLCNETDGSAEEINRTPKCSSCDRDEDDCECSYCSCCEESYWDGCDRCSMCQSCNGCTQHGNCDCDRCSTCRELLEGGRYTTTCNCDRCDGCNELVDDCECEDEDEDEDTEEEETTLTPTPADEPLTPIGCLSLTELQSKIDRIWSYVVRQNYEGQSRDAARLILQTAYRRLRLSISESELAEVGA